MQTEDANRKLIPGYTGYIPKHDTDPYYKGELAGKSPKKRIPGKIRAVICKDIKDTSRQSLQKICMVPPLGKSRPRSARARLAEELRIQLRKDSNLRICSITKIHETRSWLTR